MTRNKKKTAARLQIASTTDYASQLQLNTADKNCYKMNVLSMQCDQIKMLTLNANVWSPVASRMPDG
jgi:hypothetical protein